MKIIKFIMTVSFLLAISNQIIPTVQNKAAKQQITKNNSAIAESLIKIKQKNANFSELQATQQLLQDYTALGNKNPQLRAMIEPRIDILNQRITEQNKPQDIVAEKSQKPLDLDFQLEPKSLATEALSQQPVVRKKPKDITTQALLDNSSGMDHNVAIENALKIRNEYHPLPEKLTTQHLLDLYKILASKYSKSKSPKDKQILTSVIQPRIDILKQRMAEYNKPQAIAAEKSLDLATVDTNNNIINSSDSQSTLHKNLGQPQEQINVQNNQTTQAIARERTTNIPEINDIIKNNSSKTQQEIDQQLIELAHKTKDIPILLALKRINVSAEVQEAAIKAHNKIGITKVLNDSSTSLGRKIGDLQTMQGNFKSIGIHDPLFDTTIENLQNLLKKQGEVSIKTAWKYCTFPYSNKNLSTLFTTIKTSISNLFTQKPSTSTKINNIVNEINSIELQANKTSTKSRTPQWAKTIQRKIMNVYNQSAELAFGTTKSKKQDEDTVSTDTESDYGNKTPDYIEAVIHV